MDLAFTEELSLLPAALAAPLGGAWPAQPTRPPARSGTASPGLNLRTSSGELVFVGGVLQLVWGADAIRQTAECRLRTFRGEWFLDANLGVPWFEQVLGRKVAGAAIGTVLRGELLTIPGVTGIARLDLRFDRSTRAMSISFVLQTAAGEVAGSVSA